VNILRRLFMRNKLFGIPAVVALAGIFALVFMGCPRNDDPRPPTVPVESVTVTPVEYTLEVGQSVTLRANVAPADATDRTVTWSGFNANVTRAVPTMGTIRAAAPGPAAYEVTVYAASVGHADIIATAGGVASTAVRITVVQAGTVVPVVSVTIDPADPVTLDVDEETTITATVLPGDATNRTVAWSGFNANVTRVSYSQTDNVATVTIRGAAVGTADIIATAGGVPSTAVRITVEGEIPTFEIAMGASLHGSFEISPVTAQEGDTVTLELTRVTRFFEFDAWNITGGITATSTGENTWTFVMPGNNVTVGASFTFEGYTMPGYEATFLGDFRGRTGAFAGPHGSMNFWANTWWSGFFTLHGRDLVSWLRGPYFSGIGNTGHNWNIAHYDFITFSVMTDTTTASANNPHYSAVGETVRFVLHQVGGDAPAVDHFFHYVDIEITEEMDRTWWDITIPLNAGDFLNDGDVEIDLTMVQGWRLHMLHGPDGMLGGNPAPRIYVDSIIAWRQDSASGSYRITKGETIYGEGDFDISPDGLVQVGTTVTLTAIPDVGYEFYVWVITGATVEPVQDATSANVFTFDMPPAHITVNAEFVPEDAEFFTVTEGTVIGGGNIAIGRTSAAEGMTISLTAEADEGYGFIGWTLTGGIVPVQVGYTNEWTFEMPGNDVTVDALFESLTHFDMSRFPHAPGGIAPPFVATSWRAEFQGPVDDRLTLFFMRSHYAWAQVLKSGQTWDLSGWEYVSFWIRNAYSPGSDFTTPPVESAIGQTYRFAIMTGAGVANEFFVSAEDFTIDASFDEWVEIRIPLANFVNNAGAPINLANVTGWRFWFPAGFVGPDDGGATNPTILIADIRAVMAD